MARIQSEIRRNSFCILKSETGTSRYGGNHTTRMLVRACLRAFIYKYVGSSSKIGLLFSVFALMLACTAVVATVCIIPGMVGGTLGKLIYTLNYSSSYTSSELYY